MTTHDALFQRAFDTFQTRVHRNSLEHGWWEASDHTTDVLDHAVGWVPAGVLEEVRRSVAANECGAKLALVHSELSEALEAVREGVPLSRKLAGVATGDDQPFTLFEEEIADVVIRCMDLAERYKLRLARAIEAKHAYNRGRPHRHGGKQL